MKSMKVAISKEKLADCGMYGCEVMVMTNKWTDIGDCRVAFATGSRVGQSMTKPCVLNFARFN